MAMASTGLAGLTPPPDPRLSITVPLPASRWKSRILVPLAVFAAAAGLLIYSARSALLPATDVWVVPVVPTTRGAADNPSAAGVDVKEGDAKPVMLVQAPGWIEPDPYPINVPAMTEGVVRDLLALEGDGVQAGQVVARLIADDAQLAVESAEAQLAALSAEVRKAQADVQAAEARAAEIEDQLTRTRPLAVTGGASQAELARLEFRLKAIQQEGAAAHAALAVAAAHVRRQEVACREARLMLARTEITSPAAGIVMRHLVEPGSRISLGGRGALDGSAEPMSGMVLRLYDPKKLQVRVDVPLADCPKIHVGSVAEVVTEALPDTVLRGTVTRIVHEANIQRNTVQVKVAIHDPLDVLKPEMLARVRFFASPAKADKAGHRNPTSPTDASAYESRSSVTLLLPEYVVHARTGDRASVWLIEQDPRTQAVIATEREVRTSPADLSDYVFVTEGLRAGDRVIADAPGALRNGARVRVLGESPDGRPKHEETRP